MANLLYLTQKKLDSYYRQRYHFDYLKKFNEINNELIKYQALDENKIDLDNESYPFNKTLKELEETIEKIVTSYEGYLTTREGFNTKLDDLDLLADLINNSIM